MITRNENGEILSVDSLKDITEAAQAFRKEMDILLNNDANNVEERKQGALAKANDLKALMNCVTPELKDKASAMEKIAFVKELLKMKSVTDENQELKGKTNKHDD